MLYLIEIYLFSILLLCSMSLDLLCQIMFQFSSAVIWRNIGNQTRESHKRYYICYLLAFSRHKSHPSIGRQLRAQQTYSKLFVAWRPKDSPGTFSCITRCAAFLIRFYSSEITLHYNAIIRQVCRNSRLAGKAKSALGLIAWGGKCIK